MRDPRNNDDNDIGIPAEDLNALADRLRGWQPSAGGLDRDRLIFEAGRAAGLAEARSSFRRRLWPLACAASLLLALGLFMTRRPMEGERAGGIDLASKTAEVPQQPSPIVESAPIAPVDPNSYLALARRIADGNLDPGRTEPAHRGPDRPGPAESPSPLRARDLDRLLNL